MVTCRQGMSGSHDIALQGLWNELDQEQLGIVRLSYLDEARGLEVLQDTSDTTHRPCVPSVSNAVTGGG